MYTELYGSISADTEVNRTYLIIYIVFFSVPVCPHAGGVALCELVQHLSMFDFVCVSGTMENRSVFPVFYHL